MNYTEKYVAAREWVAENIVDVHDLIDMLDISIEDIVNLMPDRLVEYYGKIYTEEVESQDGEFGEAGEKDEEFYFDEDPF